MNKDNESTVFRNTQLRLLSLKKGNHKKEYSEGAASHILSTLFERPGEMS